jgi:hypothetical protein
MTVKLELSEQMLGVISRALGAAPFDVVVGTVMEIQKQVSAQKSGISTAINGGGPQLVKTVEKEIG